MLSERLIRIFIDDDAPTMSDSGLASLRQPTKITPPETPGLKSLLTLVTGVVIVSALYLAREVLIPITLAILLSFVLAPLVEALRRIHVPHVLSVLVAALIGLGAIGAIGGIIGMQVAGLAADVPQYASTIEAKVASVRGFTLGRISELTDRLDRQMAAPVAQRPPSPGASAQGAPDQKPIPVEVKQPASDPLSLARSVLEPILAPFESALIICIVAVFILLQKEDLRARSVADAHAMAPPAMAGVGVRMRIGVGVGGAVSPAAAIRSPMKAGAAAARCERDRRWGLLDGRERHRLGGRRGRNAGKGKGRGNQDVSHGGSPFDFQ